MTQYPALFQELQLGAVKIRNRVTMASTTRDRSVPTNVPNHVNVEFYKQRAAGGAGLIVSEGALIVQQGTEWQHAPGIWNKEQVEGWKKVTDAVHSVGGVIFCQLWHLGRINHPDAPEQVASGEPVYAPSAIAARGNGIFRFLGSPGYVTPTPIKDPRVIIAHFKRAAINAKEAGFDGVELQCDGGYIVSQFLDNTANKRTDEWGGSKENRARFGLEILADLIDVWGADRVGVKIKPFGGYNDVGMTLEDAIDTYTYFIEKVDALKLAYITLYRYSRRVDDFIDGKWRATVHDVVETYGKLIKNAKFLLNVDVTPEEGNRLIEEGKIDGISNAWLWIAHPDLANRLEQGKPIDAEVKVKQLYGVGGTDIEAQRAGYTDYPFATEVNL